MTDEKTTPDNADDLTSNGEEIDVDVTQVRVTDADAAEVAVTESDAPVADDVDDVETSLGTDAEAAASPLDEALVADDAATAAEPATTADATADGTAPHYGIGPFSLREVVLGGVWLLAFVVSFFPIYGAFGSGPSVWNGGIDWVLTIGVPTVAVFLIALRRLSPQGIRRVGSLGIDQFASVAFSVSTIVWLGILWGAFVSFAGGRVFIATWVVWLEFFLMLAGVFLTVLAPFIAPFNEDFRHRPEITAHRSARPARPVTARPAAVPAAADPYAAAAATTANAYDAGANPYAPSEDPYARDAQTFQSLDDTTVLDQQGQQEQPQAAAPAATQAFWALAPVERDVVDEQGLPLFAVGPTAWALVIEDRGDTFVVRHEDGRIGYLTDVSGVTRG